MPDENNLPGSTNTPGNESASNAGTGSTGQENVQGAKEHARIAAEELRAAAQAKAQELRGRAEDYYGQARSRAEDYYGDARQRARTLQEDGEAYIRENPVRAVFTAIGAGFILGLLFRR